MEKQDIYFSKEAGSILTAWFADVDYVLAQVSLSGAGKKSRLFWMFLPENFRNGAEIG